MNPERRASGSRLSSSGVVRRLANAMSFAAA